MILKFKHFIFLKEGTRELMPEVFEQLEKVNDPLVGVHFSGGVMKFKKFSSLSNNVGDARVTNIPHLGFNLSPHHHDPIGIYTFPKKYVLEGSLVKNDFFTTYPFFYIIKPSASARVLNLSTLTEESAKNLLSKMGIDPELINSEKLILPTTQTPTWGHKFWSALELARREDSYSESSPNISWNKLFKKTGYNVLYDAGDGIIHYNEPSQIVYLDRKSMDVVYSSRKQSDKGKIISQFVKIFSTYTPVSRKDKFALHHPDKDALIFFDFDDNHDKIIITVLTKFGTNTIGEYNYNSVLADPFINTIKSKINKIIEDQPERDVEKVDPILKKISEAYNITLKKRERVLKVDPKYRPESDYEIRKLYLDKSSDSIKYQVGFYITAQPSAQATLFSKPDLTMLYVTLKKFYPNQPYDGAGIRGYHVSINMLVNEKIPVNDIMQAAFEKLEAKATDQYKNDQYGKLNSILKTLKFLKERVFVKRNK